MSEDIEQLQAKIESLEAEIKRQHDEIVAVRAMTVECDHFCEYDQDDETHKLESLVCLPCFNRILDERRGQRDAALERADGHYAKITALQSRLQAAEKVVEAAKAFGDHDNADEWVVLSEAIYDYDVLVESQKTAFDAQGGTGEK